MCLGLPASSETPLLVQRRKLEYDKGDLRDQHPAPGDNPSVLPVVLSAHPFQPPAGTFLSWQFQKR